ncbi:MAG: hypothetical protein HN742_17360 [Lentisphaerae bacterium]|jgi:hypothetical protein|nr:hypothetical protein [Lentisphaerota bacterium]MBT4816679.1 hypothetical protein [Lentisphaerota bacterium]MBT5605670.1 hypothetical protein [Lentisphaerota bacterium]MBT7056311.1 hypothetical protein [Lentisphaerota bacterium]MBT7843650.1 hypothetical protein [Lentisphaerota bacterium]
MNEVVSLESSALALHIFDTGTFAVSMKATGCRWEPDPWLGTPCRVEMTAPGHGRQTVDVGGVGNTEWRAQTDGVELVMLGRGKGGETRVTVWLGVNGSVLHVAVRAVELPENARLETVQYPFRAPYLETGKDIGYVAVPSHEGCLIPTGPAQLGTTDFWHWEDVRHSAMSCKRETMSTMPFYGGQKGGLGYTAILETTDDFDLEYLINSNFQHAFEASGKQSPYPYIACAWPVWLSQKGILGYERRMRFEFATGLDYVGMAKAYRREALSRGHLVTLREKAEARPQIARLAGAPYLAYYAGYPHLPPGYPGFEHTYKQLQDVIDDLAGPMGLERAFVHFWGAYTTQPPGCLPFDTAPGPVEDLAEAVRKCRDHGFLFTLYNDISAQLEETNLWMPELMWKTPDGNVRPGRRWCRTCSSQYVDLLAKHMPEVVARLGLEAAYVDCINGGFTDECYDPDHPLTRTQDREARMAFYEYLHSLGLIFGGEHIGWWNAAVLEYSNGVGVAPYTHPLLQKFPVPLYHLVFHDALVPFCSAGDDYTTNYGTAFEDKVLRDLLRGIPPMYFLNLWDHAKWRRKIQDSYAVMSEPAAAVMYDEMLSHELLTEDMMVQRSTFSSGVEVTVNLDEVEREGLPGKGYRVTGLASGRHEGHFQRQLQTRQRND